MTTAEIRRFRRRLIALKKRVGGDLSALEEEALRPVGGESAGNLSDVPVHPADLGTENFDEELDLALVENQEQLLADIHDALARIERGMYGRCENCHRKISTQRLEAVPYARYCLRCAKQLEGAVRV
jgi:RNA polymerase-binding transcription factor DksA